MKWNLFIYIHTYISIYLYIYNKVIFQNKKIIMVPSKNKGDEQRSQACPRCRQRECGQWGLSGGRPVCGVRRCVGATGSRGEAPLLGCWLWHGASSSPIGAHHILARQLGQQEQFQMNFC